MWWLASPTTEIIDHRQTNLQNARDTNPTSDSITNARAAAGITARWMGRSAAGEMVEPGVDLRVHNAGTEGSSETCDRV